MKPSGIAKSIDIDNTNPLFKGTPYEGESFALTFDISKNAMIRNSVKATIGAYEIVSEEEKEKYPALTGRLSDALSIGKYFFVSGITAWAGFEDINGVELECTDTNVEGYVDDIGYNDFFEIVAKIVVEAKKPTKEEAVLDEGLEVSSNGSDGTTEEAAGALE